MEEKLTVRGGMSLPKTIPRFENTVGESIGAVGNAKGIESGMLITKTAARRRGDEYILCE
jgi:hypothetical protein